MKTKKEVTVSSEESTSGEDAPAQSSITTPAAQSLIINDQPSSEENGSNVANNTSASQSTSYSHHNQGVFICACRRFTLTNPELIKNLYRGVHLATNRLRSQTMHTDFNDFEDEYTDHEDDSAEELANGFRNVNISQPNQESGTKTEGSSVQPEDDDEDEFDIIARYPEMIRIVFENDGFRRGVLYNELPVDNPVKMINDPGTLELEPLFSDLSSDEETNCSSDNSSDETP
ncbi:uncharacterized protein LOC120636586 [Pararge aegeria]|uniref:uncharacterized protein LOC120636586 n=1 Tax=Pararge aegeria TaxID=116150 RepID=UPI0019D08024|nr:uncharacterized protein LOC120636586 [Pararge aegeria]